MLGEYESDNNPDISILDQKNTIRLKIFFKTGKTDTDYRNLIIGNPDISGTFPDTYGTLTGDGSIIFHIRYPYPQQPGN